MTTQEYQNQLHVPEIQDTPSQPSVETRRQLGAATMTDEDFRAIFGDDMPRD